MLRIQEDHRDGAVLNESAQIDCRGIRIHPHRRECNMSFEKLMLFSHGRLDRNDFGLSKRDAGLRRGAALCALKRRRRGRYQKYNRLLTDCEDKTHPLPARAKPLPVSTFPIGARGVITLASPSFPPAATAPQFQDAA